MLQYKLQKDPLTGEVRSVQKVGEPMTAIPCDPANTDYQQYLKWLEEGNQPLPADTPATE